MSWWWERPNPKKSWGTRNKQPKSSKRSNKGLGGGPCVVALFIRLYKFYQRF